MDTNKIELPISVPPEMLQESYAFIRKWLPLIIQMTQREQELLIDAVKNGEEYRAIAMVMRKGMEQNGLDYLVKEANDILSEWKDVADYNAELRDFAKEGAELALKIIVSILIAAI